MALPAISAHCVSRYIERAAPGASRADAGQALVKFLGAGAVFLKERPPWALGPAPPSTKWYAANPSQPELVVVVEESSAGVLMATTVLSAADGETRHERQQRDNRRAARAYRHPRLTDSKGASVGGARSRAAARSYRISRAELDDALTALDDDDIAS